jgi:hypothetical protein
MSSRSPAEPPREASRTSCLDENTVVELIQGLLSPAARARIEQHLDACAECRRLVAEVAKLSFAGRSSRSAREAEPDEPGSEPGPPSDHAAFSSGLGTPTGAGGGPELQVLPEQVLAGRFRIVRRLGRGSFGAVYEAEDLQLKERVALKLLRPEVQRNPSLLGHLHHEIVVGRRISHPNVCRIHDLGTWGELHFISMALIEGESLDRYLERGRPPLAVAVPILLQIASALAAAHAQGVVHRDLKPSNIMVREGGSQGVQVTVMDFGLARDLRAGPSLSGALIGSPAYWSPEQARGERATERSDLYTLGLIACDLFGVERPGFGVVPALGALPPALRPILERLLRARPEERFESADALVRALERARRRGRAHPGRTLRLAGLALLAAAAGGAGVFAYLRTLPRHAGGVAVARVDAGRAGRDSPVPDAGSPVLAALADLGGRPALVRKPGRKPARTSVVARLDARAPLAAARRPDAATPRPASAIPALRERLARLEGERRRRGILLDDLAGARAALASARRALGAGEEQAARTALGTLEQSLQGVAIDGAFVRRKLARLNALKGARKLDATTEQKIATISASVHQRFFSGDYAGANAQLNSLFALLGHGD